MTLSFVLSCLCNLLCLIDIVKAAINKKIICTLCFTFRAQQTLDILYDDGLCRKLACV